MTIKGSWSRVKDHDKFGAEHDRIFNKCPCCHTDHVCQCGGNVYDVRLGGKVAAVWKHILDDKPDPGNITKEMLEKMADDMWYKLSAVVSKDTTAD